MIYECDRVLIYGGRILCGVGNIAGHFSDLLIPTGEGVGILCIGCLIGGTLEARCCTVCIGFFCFITVYDPNNGVVVDGGIVGCGVSCITCYFNNGRSPACKCVGVLRIGSLGGSFTCISRCITVSNFTGL